MPSYLISPPPPPPPAGVRKCGSFVKFVGDMKTYILPGDQNIYGLRNIYIFKPGPVLGLFLDGVAEADNRVFPRGDGSGRESILPGLRVAGDEGGGGHGDR